MRRAASMLLAGSLALGACARRTDTSLRPAHGRVEARGFAYADEAGLSVSTLGVTGEQELSPALSANVEALADHVVNAPPPPVRPKPIEPGQPTGHRHPGVDVVTSASVLASNEPVKTDKWRFEGIAGVTSSTQLGGDPVRVRAIARGSTEPDYKSLSARLSGEAELFDRNTTVTGFLGYGHDTLLPTQAPPGQEALWPAHHDRVHGGASLSQLLSRELVGSAGLAFTHQWGTLSSPYRRALVITTLFPEVLPSTRERFTAFAALSWALGGGTALHLRQGAYADSWGVWAVIPELTLAKEIGSRALVSFHYRFYGQAPAAFYQPVYPGLEPLLSGDPRLGELRDHVGGVEVRWTPWGRFGWSGSLTVVGGYELSNLSYPQLESAVRAQIFSLGVTGAY